MSQQFYTRELFLLKDKEIKRPQQKINAGKSSINKFSLLLVFIKNILRL
jgi:hypothetical protein